MAINIAGYQQNQQNQSGYSKAPGINEFVPEEGKSYMIRVLPRDMEEYEKDLADDFGYINRYHYSYTKLDGTKIYDIPCLRKHDKDIAAGCSICDESYEAYKAQGKGSDIGKSLYRKQNKLINIIDLSTQESTAKGVQWWKAPVDKICKVIEKYLVNPMWMQNGKDILDIDNGMIFQIDVTPPASKDSYREYSVMPTKMAIDMKAVLNMCPDWRERIASLKNKIHKMTREEMAKLLSCEAKSVTPGFNPGGSTGISNPMFTNPASPGTASSGTSNPMFTNPASTASPGTSNPMFAGTPDTNPATAGVTHKTLTNQVNSASNQTSDMNSVPVDNSVAIIIPAKTAQDMAIALNNVSEDQLKMLSCHGKLYKPAAVKDALCRKCLHTSTCKDIMLNA